MGRRQEVACEPGKEGNLLFYFLSIFNFFSFLLKYTQFQNNSKKILKLQLND